MARRRLEGSPCRSVRYRLGPRPPFRPSRHGRSRLPSQQDRRHPCVPLVEVADGLFGELARAVQRLVQPRARHLQTGGQGGRDVRFCELLQIHDESVDGQKSGVLVGSYERQFLAELANDLGRLARNWEWRIRLGYRETQRIELKMAGQVNADVGSPFAEFPRHDTKRRYVPEERVSLNGAWHAAVRQTPQMRGPSEQRQHHR